jgi:soluble lytic murein transglycosylase-like protein
MTGTVLRRLWPGLVLVSALVPAPGAPADGTDVVLLRLSRVARGEWTPLRRSLRSVPYASEIRAASLRHGISPSLLAALVRAESNFDSHAVSVKGARGLGQLLPRTARELGVSNAFDPEQNLSGSARYLSKQLDRFDNVALALAAYHAGPSRAERGFEKLPRETRVYVATVMRLERNYRRKGIP